MGRDVSYTVHLTEDTPSADGRTVETDHLDFYDSGVWVARDEGRDFYPYQRIAVIQQRPSTVEETPADAEAASDASPAGASQHEASEEAAEDTERRARGAGADEDSRSDE